ncbi:MAG: N,N-dimethylformamidase beta subunit family domain-containing protein [Bacteroidota bacterium]
MIKTTASAYTIAIYRIGYYQGHGARFKGNGVITAALPQSQPADLYDTATGLTECSNWAVSGYWAVPANAVSGIYLAKLTRTDNNGASHIAFIVRDDASASAVLFKTSDATWQAYNGYGGNSLYVNNSGITVPGFVHATKVSYDRPFYTRGGGGGGGAEEDWFMNSEYPMIRFMERNGYDITYTTDLDMDRSMVNITPAKHKVLLSVGHDEYWSAAERARFENARNAGVHLGFFSGNEVYWKTRWENNNRTMVCYKEGTLGENTCGTKCDPQSTIWTGSWRDGCAFPLADGCSSENSLSGQISWDGTTGSMTVPDTYKNLRFWRNTGVAALGTNQTATFLNGTLGYEWDWEQAQYASAYPASRIHLSSTTLNNHTHHLSLYRHPSGALVFGAGTVQWMWGLDSIHDRGNAAPDPSMQQATINLFAEMGVQPATLQSSLMAAASTGDLTAPVSTITSPANTDSVVVNSVVVITGSATDAGVVAAVDISVDGGTTWARATGTTSWTYNWTPSVVGTVALKTRAVDDWGNLSAASAATNVVVEAQPCPCTLFASSSVPASIDNRDNGTGIELGMKFRSTVNGYISAIRFYKGSSGNGTFTGHLWTAAGSSLSSATLTLGSGSGWQRINLSAPVAITANTTYVVSYHSPSGYYNATNPFFSGAVVNGPLRGLANGEDGANGVYDYTATPAFPLSNYQSGNYWVDVVFDTTITADVTPPTILSTTPSSSATGVSLGSTISVTFNENMDTTTLSTSTIELKDAGNNAVPFTLSKTLNGFVLTPTGTFLYNTVYTIRIKGGANNPRAKDVAGNALASDNSFSFTSASASANEGPGGPVLIISSATNPFSRYTVELLKAEGMNEFLAMDLSLVTSQVLNNYDIVVLGETALSPGEVTMLTNWVTAGGKLIVFKPDAQLLPLLGLTAAGGTLSDKYLLIPASGPGIGIVNQTMQYHGTANRYTLNGAASLATLYSDASTATAYPAVTAKNVGPAGGQAIAFAYDLNRSVVYTRQGNPAWAGDERDGQSGPIRSNDLFFGNKTGDVQADWVDFNKIQIPQADEQQRFLVNIILKANLSVKPLPRFWYLPKGLKAAVIMTGDDHGVGGTIARFNQYKTASTANTQTAVDDWTAVRGTSYIYPNTPITNTQVVNFQNEGFEIGLHVTTNCANYTQSSLTAGWTSQYSSYTSNFPGAVSPKTNRTHCIAWSDWASQAKVQAAHGVRMDVNYYYFPDTWIQNRPGLFTGSGMPMRFADLDGSLIDCYQVATQLTDESGQTMTTHINTLLDNAIGSKGYYGAFCTNMHTDNNTSAGSDDIIASAQARNIPVISAAQMLKWVDARESSSFNAITWNNDKLGFTITAGAGSKHLKGMLPVNSQDGVLDSLFYNNAPITYSIETIKGIEYAFFDATLGNGTYEADYKTDTLAPVISNIMAVANSSGQATITWKTNEPATSKIDYDTLSNSLVLSSADADLDTLHSITLTGLAVNSTYYYRVTSGDLSGNTSVAPPAQTLPLSFIVPADCFVDQSNTDFATGTLSNIYISKITNGELMLQPGKVAEFDVLPSTAEWNSFAWTGGVSSVSSGVLSVEGSRYNTQPSSTTYGPGSSLEFVATFGAAGFQHIGFGGGSDANGTGGIYNGDDSWAMFSTHNTNNTLKARTFIAGGSSSDFTITGISNLIGSPHSYRIEWKTDGSFGYYVDGALMRTEPLIISTQMRPAASDYNNDATPVRLDWIRVSPYSASGSFESKVYDAGVVKSWDNMSWNSSIPAATTLTMQVRTGNVAVPDGSWSAYTTIAAPGNPVNAASRYIQYKGLFTTSDTKTSPVLNDVSLSCSPVVAPTVSVNPDSTSACENSTVRFVSRSAGNPVAAVLWQVSANAGNSWTDIPSSANDTLSFTAVAADHHKQYRAVWSNAGGSVNTSAALLKVNPTGTWIGSANNNGISPGNWCGGTLPDSAKNVTVAGDAEFMPTVGPADTLHVKDLVIESGATLTINGTIAVSANIINNGTIVANSGSIVLNGKVPQSISGNAFGVERMKLDNTAGATLNTAVSIVDAYIPVSGTLAANGNLIIRSTATQTARIGEITTGADVTGNVTVQRFIPAIVRRSRMISPNVNPFACNDLIDDIFVTGAGGSTNGFDVSINNQNTIYTYRELTSGSGRGWKALSNISDTLSAGSGSLVFVRGDRTLSSPQWYTPPYVSQNEVTIDFTGAINKGTISPAVSYTNTNAIADDGWNLVGNPYPSQIDWNEVGRVNVSPFYYTLDPSSGSYVAEDGSNLIASGQAFFVQAIAPSPAITFEEAAKATAAPVSYFKVARAILKATMIKDAVNSDQLKIEFATGANVNYSASEDAVKLTNQLINFATLSNNGTVQLQHNKMPALSTATDTIALFADAAIGQYRFRFEGMQDIDAAYAIYLKDAFNNTIQNLRSDPEYAFSISSNAASKGNGRFKLVFVNPGLLPVQLVNFKAEIHSDNQVKLSWTTTGEKNNKGFSVERTNNLEGNQKRKIKWQKIGFVKGSYNSNKTNNYTYTDLSPFGLYDTELFYRLKQVDANDKESLSKVVFVRKATKTVLPATVKVYPNPFTGEVSLLVQSMMSSKAIIEVYDLTGKPVLSEKRDVTIGDNKFDLSALKDVARGVYFVTVTMGEERHVRKLIKQ